jgi:transposase-like protein
MNTTKKEAEPSILEQLASAYGDEQKARELLERLRWPHGPVCPHCQNAKDKRISRLVAQNGRKKAVRPGVYFCGACRRQFTVTVGTVLEGTHVPLAKWVLALFLFCSSKKSLSANQIHRMVGVTYKTAWFMCHRMRFAMTANHWAEPKLTGTVEVDETFVGGKGDLATRSRRKTPVVALVERHGLARVKIIASVTQKNLGAALSECVSQEAIVNTDEHPGYRHPLKHWKQHQAVNHSQENINGRTQTVRRPPPIPPSLFSRCSNAELSAPGIIFPASICQNMPMSSLSVGIRAGTPKAPAWYVLWPGPKVNASPIAMPPIQRAFVRYTSPNHPKVPSPHQLT